MIRLVCPLDQDTFLAFDSEVDDYAILDTSKKAGARGERVTEVRSGTVASWLRTCGWKDFTGTWDESAEKNPTGALDFEQFIRSDWKNLTRPQQKAFLDEVVGEFVGELDIEIPDGSDPDVAVQASLDGSVEEAVEDVALGPAVDGDVEVPPWMSRFKFREHLIPVLQLEGVGGPDVEVPKTRADAEAELVRRGVNSEWLMMKLVDRARLAAETA